MDPNLPATRAEAPTEVGLAEVAPAEVAPAESAPGVAGDAAPTVEHHQPVSVAFLPFALIVFLVLAFVVAGWTFFTAAY